MSPHFDPMRVIATTAVLACSSVMAIMTDSIWHDRYHALLAMSTYGDYNTLCPQQTFTQAGMLKNFPTSTFPPWTVLERWGPTASGSHGYSVFTPETGKCTIVMGGNYLLEKSMASRTDVVPLDTALGIDCDGCMVNEFALSGWLEAKAATNNFEKTITFWQTTRDAWWNQTQSTLFLSLTGHGLGGAHALIASVEYAARGFSYFTHSYGSPRIFNPAAAAYYDFHYGGDLTERAVANHDVFPTIIPAGPNAVFTNTALLWYGVNETYGFNWNVCYETPEAPECQPMEPYNELDHYFYFANVGQCGGSNKQDVGMAQNFIASAQAAGLGNLGTASVTIPSARVTTLTAASTYAMGIGPSQAALMAAGVSASAVNASVTPAIVLSTASFSASVPSPSNSASQLVTSPLDSTLNQTQGINAAARSANSAVAISLAAYLTFLIITI